MTEVQIDASQIGNIAGKVAIVTGGASGIGKALVDLLHARGAIVYFCDVNLDAGNAVQAYYHGKDVHFIKADVSNWTELSAFFAQVRHFTGRIDHVYANAGYSQKYDLWGSTFDDDGQLAEPSTATLDVTLKGTIYTAKLALHHFRLNPTPGGSLLLTASSTSYNPRPNLPLYSTSKHGVLGLFRSLHPTCLSQNVVCAAVAPAATQTGMLTPLVSQRMADAGIVVQRAEDVAKVLVVMGSGEDQRKWNGKMMSMYGGRCWEVESKVWELQSQWYGEWPTEQAQKGGTVNFQPSATT